MLEDCNKMNHYGILQLLPMLIISTCLKLNPKSTPESIH